MVYLDTKYVEYLLKQIENNTVSPEMIEQLKSIVRYGKLADTRNESNKKIGKCIRCEFYREHHPDDVIQL